MKQTADRRGANENRGQAGPLSYALVFAMVLAGATVVLMTGGMALSDAQDTAEAQRAEHTMTLFDSRAAMVALGESGSQSVSFGQDSGIFETRPTDGYLMIKHTNYDDSGSNQVLYKEPLGAVVYENGERELAYQGGGVWRKDPQGDAQVISPPEFHYRGETLTLPVIRVNGNASGAGSVTARIRADTRAEKVYPDVSTQYPSSSQNYLNPVENGSVAVWVKSDYYRGWATYFRERTEGNVTAYDNNQTVRVELASLGGAPGAFTVPDEGRDLDVEALGSGHPLTDFTLSLTADNKFRNGHWSFYTTQGGDKFEIHIDFGRPGKCQHGSFSNDVSISVYYYNSTNDVSHEWQNTSIDANDPDGAFYVDCPNLEANLDFTNENTNLTYRDMDVTGSKNKWWFGPSIEDDLPPSSIVHDNHTEDGDRTFQRGTDDATIEYVVNHYMSRTGQNYELTVTDGPGGSTRIDELDSMGELRYAEAGGPEYITYLHVTDNEINVTIGS